MAGRNIFTYASTGRPSLESILGWESQYERLGRWCDRLRGADSSLDMLLAFILNCYALRDWLVNGGALESRVTDAAIQADFHMGLCRHLCNRSKHLVLSRPSVDPDFFFALTYRGQDQPPGIVVLARGKIIDLHDAAAQCMTSWENFLQRRVLRTGSDTGFANIAQPRWRQAASGT